MRKVRHYGVGLVLGMSLIALAYGQDRLPDRRAVTAPVVVGPGGSGSDAAVRQNLVELLQQVEQLQSEVRQLRDRVEVQNHELEQMKARQQDLIGDLDRRLRELERGGVAGAPAAPSAAPTAVPAPVSASQQQEYDAAFALMKQGYYERAVKAFRSFLAKYPDSGLADNAQYWIGEGNYVLRNYKLALEEFNKVLSDYPRSPKQGDALLKIGYVHYELGAYDKANKTLKEVIARYPNTTVAKSAATRLDKMQKEGR